MYDKIENALEQLESICEGMPATESRIHLDAAMAHLKDADEVLEDEISKEFPNIKAGFELIMCYNGKLCSFFSGEITIEQKQQLCDAICAMKEIFISEDGE